ncbi:hypothetical protein Vi05172_g9561 [Venturia inaequalis]|nr:hypothetical protein Vi05172_g9561 [Venturia inaequalis]
MLINTTSILIALSAILTVTNAQVVHCSLVFNECKASCPKPCWNYRGGWCCS